MPKAKISPRDPGSFEMIHPEPKHFKDIQELCKRVYPFSKPWSLDHLHSHRLYFPDGQLIVIDKETNKVVGMAFSLIISWDDYSPQDNWVDFTSSGFFHNHNPKKGRTLYGAEVMVDPEYRGQGIGKMLYKGRQEIAHRYHLSRIRAGARLRGYSKFKDQYTPQEYVKKVYNKEIFDPTLSFQLGQGFVPIDTAGNYLYNDPESLGFAAVIEWLNPEAATERDFRKQQESVKFFLEHQKLNVEHLPKELRRIVRKMTFLLGQSLKEQEGSYFFDKIETYRKTLKSMRTKKSSLDLSPLMKKIQRESPENQLKIAHAFSLLLEVVNSCESSYRTWRQRQKSGYNQPSTHLDLTFVLTAHPTEARAPLVIEIFRRLSELILEGLENNFVFNEDEINTLLHALISIPLVKTKPPKVVDEAEYIYSIIFNEPIFKFILTKRDPYRIRLRTWVGGDKDGHPGVDERTMTECLMRSRYHIIQFIHAQLESIITDVDKLGEFIKIKGFDRSALFRLNDQLKSLKILKNGDGKRVAIWMYSFYHFIERANFHIQNHHKVQLIKRVFELFPSLVLPIELREDAGKIELALKDPSAPISKMISTLSRLSKGSDITDYARGLVISHCEESKDLNNALALIQKCGGQADLPTIPLFESKEALKASEKILVEWLSTRKTIQIIQTKWNEKLEVMFGYSDSAKQVGVLPSRSLIKSSMNKVSKVSKKYKLKPVFFHGSGGSVARGGGNLKEQISWWPTASTRAPKLTVQGEMIQRTFATKEILHSQGIHFAQEMRLRRAKKTKVKTPPAFKKLCTLVERQYVDFVGNPQLLGDCLNATPYNYLEVLKIGSRPSKRPTENPSVNSLRAIPWVLCWTQSRVLFPTWWGVGAAWKNLTHEEKAEIKTYFEEDPFFSSFVKQMSFTLAKVELKVWAQYLNKFSPKNSKSLLKMFESEYQDSVKFCLDLSEKDTLLWHRPWLEES
ncbi:phosphoenolpyruvate carboxylase, partial [bacterium]|nr:phosphoenolpyruvate carboxylase [bacterium]